MSSAELMNGKTNGLLSHVNELHDESKLTNGFAKHTEIVNGLNHASKSKPLGEQSRAVRRQELMVVLGNIGCLAGGMGLGMSTVVLHQLTNPREPVYLTPTQASWFASINTLSCPLAGLISMLILDKWGRKFSLYILNLIALASWTLLALSNQEDSHRFYVDLLISRFLIGIAAGLVSAPVGVYSAEISLPKIRGRLILGTSLSIAGGITLMYIIGYFIRDDFRLIALICCAYQIIAMLCVIPMPETPSWLLSKNRVDEAKKSLNYFRGLEKKAEITHPEVLQEFNILQKSLQLKDGEKRVSFIKSLVLPEVYKPLLILIGLFSFQQLSGIFVVIVYAVQISVEAGVTIDPLMCAVLIGASRVITTCPMGVILEKWGRRRSGIISTLGMTCCMILLAAYHWFDWLHHVPYLPVTAIVAFIVLSTLGLYTLPFFMISELFPQKVRGPAAGLTIAIGMFMSFVCIKTYPDLKAAIGNNNCFVFYGIMSFIAMIFIYMVLPETRRRTLLEIEEQFRMKTGGRKTKTLDGDIESEMKEVFVR